MKIFLAFLVSLLVMVEAQAQVVRVPRVSTEMWTKIEHYKSVAGADHFVHTEGQWSYPWSAVEGTSDYFVVKASNSDGVRILKMDPIKLAEGGGMLGTPMFHDVITGREHYPAVGTQVNGNGGHRDHVLPDGFVQGYFHFGKMPIDDDVYNVFIAHWGTTSNLTVYITWGEGSTPFDVGSHLDSYEVSVPYAEPTVTSLTMIQAKEVPGWPDGNYLIVDSPENPEELKIEVSSDLSTWTTAEVAPSIIFGNTVFYQIPNEGIGFFRAIGQ